MNDVVIDVNAKTGFANLRKFDNIIGNQYQNLQNKLKFELNEFIDGVAWLEYQIDGKKNYALMEKYDKGYQIDIKSCLLTSSHVEVDLKITEEETPEGVPIFVSTIIDLRVMKTINAEDEKPEEYPSWFESASKVINDANNLDLDVTKSNGVATVIVTKKDGTEKSIKIYDGSANLDDKVASETPELFGRLKQNGELIPVGTRINWNGVLKRASVDLYDTLENNPDNAPVLWEDIEYKEGYRIIPEIITVGTAFSLNEYGWWNDTLYKSLLDNNVWTPVQNSSGWEIVEVR